MTEDEKYYLAFIVLSCIVLLILIAVLWTGYVQSKPFLD